MAKGKLEVLLVDANGIKDRERQLLGCLFCLNPCNEIKLCPYVVIHYGDQETTSRVADRKKVWNNEKRVERVALVNLRYTSVFLLAFIDNGDLEINAGEGKKLEWNETFTFDAEYNPGVEDQPYKLVLQIFDKHNISENNLVGQTTIYIKDVMSLGAENGEAELRTQKYRVVLPDKTYSGEISVGVTFTLDV